jgi:hypothetical protein
VEAAWKRRGSGVEAAWKRSNVEDSSARSPPLAAL